MILVGYFMTEVETLIEKKLQLLKPLFESGKYDNCYSISDDLIKLSWQLESKFEVFLFEVLEMIFKQLKEPFVTYSIPKEILEEMKSKTSQCLDDIIKYYISRDNDNVLKTLIELRYLTSHYQYTVRENYGRKLRHALD